MSSSDSEITLPRFNDMHVHLRDSPLALVLLSMHMAYCDNIMAMPNTRGAGLNTVRAVDDYLDKLGMATGLHVALKLDDLTTPELIKQAAAHPRIIAAKLYPDGVTTNSNSGITDIRELYPVFEAMEKHQLVLSIHGEHPEAFCLDREAEFIDSELKLIQHNFPKLRIVLEHISTAEAVAYIRAQASPDIAATITPHHLMLTLDDVVGDKLQPLNFCKPIAKRSRDWLALCGAATSGESWFFLGSDSAPHASYTKYRDCGCAGCFTGPIVPELLAETFSTGAALDKLPDFASNFGADFYRLERTAETFQLYKRKRKMIGRWDDSWRGTSIDPSALPIFMPPGGYLEWSQENTEERYAAMLNVNGRPYALQYSAGHDD